MGFLRMLLVCFRSFVKSVLRYIFLLVWIPIIPLLGLRQQGYEGAWLIFETKRDPRAEKFAKQCSRLPGVTVILQ